MSMKDAIANENWEHLRVLILQKHSQNRRHVGLEPKSDLSALQLVAMYEREHFGDLLQAGLSCDLHSACALGIESFISDANPVLFGESAEYLTPMGWAILAGQELSIDALLSNGDDPNRPLARAGFFEWEIQALNRVSWMPIHLASVHGYRDSATAMVRSLAKAGAEIEFPSPLGYAALSLASIYSWTSVMDSLLDLGADINAKSEPESDLVWRLSAPKYASVRTHGLTPLMVAVGEGQEKAVDLLIKRGCDLEQRNSTGSSALHIAANPWWQENTAIVEHLLASGANPTAIDNNNHSPFDLARNRGLDNTARLLK